MCCVPPEAVCWTNKLNVPFDPNAMNTSLEQTATSTAGVNQQGRYSRTSYHTSQASDWSRWPSRPIRSLRCMVTCTRKRRHLAPPTKQSVSHADLWRSRGITVTAQASHEQYPTATRGPKIDSGPVLWRLSPLISRVACLHHSL